MAHGHVKVARMVPAPRPLLAALLQARRHFGHVSRRVQAALPQLVLEHLRRHGGSRLELRVLRRPGSCFCSPGPLHPLRMRAFEPHLRDHPCHVLVWSQ